MARKSLDAVVAGRNYSINHFPGGEGLEIGFELARIATPILVPLFAAKKDQEFTVELADKIARAVVDTLEPKKAVALVKRLFSTTFVEKGEEVGDIGGNVEKIFDVHFSGNLENAFGVLSHVVQHNFEGFFSGLVALVPGMGKG